MTRYDPHPQDYDDARTGPQASREAAGRDETTSRVSGGGWGLRAALEAAQREQVRLHESRDAAEARARRAENALRAVSGYSDNCGCSRCQQVRHVLSDAALSDEATPSDTAGLREALERLLEFPNWTYIDGVLTAVVLPEDLRAVLSAHPADAPAGEEELTRYDPHPQDYDDARTFGPVDAERRPHDGMPHRGSCGDCGALLTVPNVVGTTQPDATVLRASDETGPGVPEGGGGLRGALEALADQWAWILYSREGLPLREDDFDRGWNAAMACDLTRLRAVLAAHPADAEAPEPSEDVVERRHALPTVHGAEPRIKAYALADAGLLADPVETERAEWLLRWVQRDRDGMRLLRDEAVGERDRARQFAAALEADNARLTEALREIQAAIGLPAVVCGQVSMPVRYEKARKAADAALSDGATR